MPQARFNHIALSVPPGSLAKHRADIERFYGGILGATVFDYGGVGNYLIISFDEGFPSQSLVLNEAQDYMQAPGFDHVGLEFETYEGLSQLARSSRKATTGLRSTSSRTARTTAMNSAPATSNIYCPCD